MELRTHRGKIHLEAFFEEVRTFHGSLAPGVVLGGLMVDWALEETAPCEALDAVVETRKCLPDAVQLLTKCSIGNGWLRILDWGKLAITLYDIETLEGARVHLDLEKAERFPRIRAWAMKEVQKKENPLEPLIEEMISAGRDVLTCRKGVLQVIPNRPTKYFRPLICAECGEGFRYSEDSSGGVCMACRRPFFKEAAK